MNPSQVRVLLLEDNPDDAFLLVRNLRNVASPSFQLTHVAHLSRAIEALSKDSFDLALVDLGLPDGNGLENIAKITAVAPSMSVVVLTGADDEELATAALSRGAQDYLVKGEIVGKGLIRTLVHAVERKRLEEERLALAAKLDRQQARLDAFFACAPVALAMLDDQVRFIKVNELLASLTGRTLEEHVGLSVEEAFPDRAGLTRPIIDEVLATGVARTAEVNARTPARPTETRDWLVTYFPVPQSREGSKEAAIIAVDVTQQKKIEAALRDALANIKTLSGLLPICAWCKAIRDDKGYWSEVEDYLADHTTADFTHGICPLCQARVQQNFKP